LLRAYETTKRAGAFTPQLFDTPKLHNIFEDTLTLYLNWPPGHALPPAFGPPHVDVVDVVCPPPGDAALKLPFTVVDSVDANVTC